MKRSNHPGQVLAYLLLGLSSILSVFPFYMIFSMGTYKTADLMRGLPLIPSNYFLENVKTALSHNLLGSYANSIMISAAAVVLALITSCGIGYALAKFRFLGKKLFYTLVLIGMMLPTQISVIGYMIEMRTMKLTGTYMSLLCTWIAHPFSAFFMAQFMKTGVPSEMLESARIDGCSEPGILIRIVLPCILPGLATMATLIWLWSWNSYLLPLIAINKPAMYTIPLMVANLAAAYSTDYGAQMCSLALATLPILILFICGSKVFIRGLTAGAIKG